MINDCFNGNQPRLLCRRLKSIDHYYFAIVQVPLRLYKALKPTLDSTQINHQSIDFVLFKHLTQEVFLIYNGNRFI
jgi:hypothetical protein